MHLKMVATQQIADIVELAEVLLLYKENQLPETDRSIRETYPRTQNLIFISFSPQTDSLTLTLKMKQQMNYWLLQELSHAKKGIKVGKCWTHLPKVQNIKGYWHWHWILRARARNMNYGEYFLGGSSIKCSFWKQQLFLNSSFSVKEFFQLDLLNANSKIRKNVSERLVFYWKCQS